MQILGGRFRSLKLFSLKTSHIRPTTGVVKAAIFNICQSIIEGSNFLDLFCGSGAMGCEALSRGAAFSTFVDNNKEAISIVKNNLKALDIEEKGRVFLGDAFQILKLLSRKKEKFNIIYIDPPYDLATDELVLQLLEAIEEGELLSDQGLLFIERGFSKEAEKEEFSKLKKIKWKRNKRFGIALIHQFWR
jgi:16S rRNA (guanine966-N2)-methyltransferase